MELSKLLLPEFQMEMAGTRKLLERLPDELLAWRLNEKSNTVGGVANHLSDLPEWVVHTLDKDFLDFRPEGGPPYQTPAETTTSAILERFDRNVAAATGLLEKATNESLMQLWSLKQAGTTLFQLPRYNVLRTWVLNHIIHHRGNLCAYCREQGVPVPALYGPSADES